MVMLLRAPRMPCCTQLLLMCTLINSSAALDNGLGRTPVMGWNRWAGA